MGSQESKVEQSEEICEESVMKPVEKQSPASSPILTPGDPRSPTANIARTPLELLLAQKAEIEPIAVDETNSKELVNLLLASDPRSPTCEFDRTPIVVGTIPKHLQNTTTLPSTPVTTIVKKIPSSVGSHQNKRKSLVGLLETNLDYTETDIDAVCQAKQDLNKTLPLEIIEDLPCNQLKNQMETLKMGDCVSLEPKLANITAQVKDFDKKLTHLIYEDETDDDKDEKPQKVKLAGENNRTPLANRNSNEDSKKKNRLRVSDKPRKSESRIPVLKDHFAKKLGQCENTPPTMMQSPAKKMPHWDADKTLVI